MNIKFNYLYRDSSNYKNFNAVVFPNPKNKDINTVDITIKMHFIDKKYFEAKKISLPDLHFENPNLDDHNWHEYSHIEHTTEDASDDRSRSIDEFINDIIFWNAGM